MFEFYMFDHENIILTVGIINTYYSSGEAEGTLNSITDTCTSVLGAPGL